MQMFTLHNWDLCKITACALVLMLSLKEVMVVLFITGTEMKGDLEECTAVGSKSHDLAVESSNAGGRRRQTSVC